MPLDDAPVDGIVAVDGRFHVKLSTALKAADPLPLPRQHHPDPLDPDTGSHTYAAYGRGVEVMMHAYRLLDITALGRHEDWEEPKGRVPAVHVANPGFEG